MQIVKGKEYETLSQNEGEAATINPAENIKERQLNIDDESQQLVH